MKLFKNGIDIKWLLLLVGIIVSVGYAIASTNIYLTDTGATRFDALNLTYGLNASRFDDINNPIYYVDPSNTGTSINVSGGINGTEVNISSSGVMRGKVLINGNMFELRGYNSTGSVKTQLQMDTANTLWYMSGMGAGAGDSSLCWNSGTAEASHNSGTSCTPSAEKYKNIEATFSDSIVDNKFNQIHGIIYTLKSDKKHLQKFGFNANEIAVLYPQTIYTNYQGSGTFTRLILNKTNPNKADGVQYSDGVISDIEGINYEMLSVILVNQVQNQQFQLDIQSNQIRNICTNNPQLCS